MELFTKEWYELDRSKKIYVYYDEEGDSSFINSTINLQNAINKVDIIKTTNTYALTFDTYTWGYDLYLVSHGITMKIYPYMDCPSTNKELRPEHNLERLVRSGCVDTI